jgi:hypothetical protein
VKERVSFRLNGVQHEMSRGDAVRKLSRVEPGRIQVHAVEVEGVLYPVKEAFAHVIGLDLLDFTTNQARRVFRDLGFRVIRRG